MLKKTIFSSLYLILIGGLIWGAINRTSSTLKTDDKNSHTDLTKEIVGLIFKTATPPSENNQDIGIAEPTKEINSLTSETATIPSENHQDLESADTSEHTWESLNGKISVLNNRGAVVTLENGSTISINPRPWRFAQAQGLQAQLGDTLLLTGFYEEEGKFEVAHLKNLNNGTDAQIRDEDGHPLWVSGGNGK